MKISGTQPTTAVASILQLQGMVGNRAVAQMLAPPGSPPLPTARSGVLLVQRDIKPGENLPDTAAIGQQRIAKRLEPGRGGRKLAAFPSELQKAAFDMSTVNRLLDERRGQLEDLYRRVFANPPKDPDTLEGLVQAEVPKHLVNRMQIAEVQVEIFGLVNSDLPLTAERASKHLRETFAQHNDPRFVLADQIIGVAQSGVPAVVDAAMKQEVTDEWQRITSRPAGASFGEVLSPKEKKAFAAELKKLPSLEHLAKAHEGEAAQLQIAAGVRWRNGGFLSDDIDEVNLDDDDKAVPADKQYRAPLDDGTFRKSVFQADRMLRALVEPDVLGALDRPKVKVHPLKNWQFRAFQADRQVHLAADEEVPLIVHEVGHYLEDEGAVESWADIQRLIGKRHEQAGGGERTVKGPLGLRKEGRYRGNYPATGKYTSKAYDTGSTEVMSMTVEYLSRPSTFAKMVENDPVQTATVLRTLQPQAYAQQSGLRKFNKYLPS